MNINELLDKKAAELNVDYLSYKRNVILNYRKVGNLLFTAGSGCGDFRQGCIGGDKLVNGKPNGEKLTFEDGYLACQRIALIQLNMIRDALGDLDRVVKLHRAFGLCTVHDDFHELDKMFDGFSDIMYEVFRDRGRHTRTIMGSRNLPVNNTSAEIELILSFRD